VIFHLNTNPEIIEAKNHAFLLRKNDQWVLADKRMHINNKWWRRIRRLVKSSLLQLCHCSTTSKKEIMISENYNREI
jgi:hypothetical protein